MASCNDWQSQPRDPETGRWKARKGEWQPRRDVIHVRLTRRERRLIEQAAADADKTITQWLVDAALDHAEQGRREALQPQPMTHQQRLAGRLPQNRGRR